jgi:hypothetical protein
MKFGCYFLCYDIAKGVSGSKTSPTFIILMNNATICMQNIQQQKQINIHSKQKYIGD